MFYCFVPNVVIDSGVMPSYVGSTNKIFVINLNLSISHPSIQVDYFPILLLVVMNSHILALCIIHKLIPTSAIPPASHPTSSPSQVVP